MRLGILSLCLGVSSMLACARPTLPEDEGDGGLAEPEPEPDASVPSSTAQRDAARPPVQPIVDSSVATVVDAGKENPATVLEDAAVCGDRDKDGVCDAEDNCPVDANKDQADADGDGIGDVCAPVNCGNDKLDVETNLGNNATVSRVAINNRQGKLATVKPGATVPVDIVVQFTECSIALAQQVFLGVETSTPSCAFAGCTSAIPISIPLPLQFDVVAPTTPGLHYLFAGIVDAPTCSGNNTPDQKLAKRVAALCVSN